jgi:hypothetical protein
VEFIIHDFCSKRASQTSDRAKYIPADGKKEGAVEKILLDEMDLADPRPTAVMTVRCGYAAGNREAPEVPLITSSLRLESGRP